MLTAAPAIAQTTRPALLRWDMWVATDGLGRSLPTFDHVGSLKPNRTALMFYYLWQDDHKGVVRDMAKVLASDLAAHVKVERDESF